MRNEEELAIQKAFIDWCWANWTRWPSVAIKIPRRARMGRKTVEIMAWSVPFFHPANGEVRDSKTGAKLNALGLRRGILDLFLPVPTAKHCGLVVEVKRPGKSEISKWQKIWIDFLRSIGWRVEVCKSVAECVDVTIKYLDSR